MDEIKSVFPNYDKRYAPLMRRLAGALVAQWANLPPDIQQRLLEQAVFTHDVLDTVQLKEQLSGFIRKHQGWPPTPV